MEAAEHDDPNAAREDEMPLLFMNELPADFRQNAQLAAIATFMDSSDEEGAATSTDGYEKTRRRTCTKRSESRRKEPYNKKPARANDHKNVETSDTKELQLFLSMFHVT